MILDHNWLVNQFLDEINRTTVMLSRNHELTILFGVWGVLTSQQQAYIEGHAKEVGIRLRFTVR